MHTNKTKQNTKQWWRQWLTIGRIVPLSTVAIAITVGALSIVGVLQTTPTEGVIITLLALLALDALTERLSLLEKIESHLKSLPRESILKDRSQLPNWVERGRSASEIVAVGVSLISLIVSQYDFFEQKLKEDCRLRFLLLNPESKSLDTWHRLSIVSSTKSDIESSLATLKVLMEQQTRKGRCEVRLAPTFLPFGAVLFDPDRTTGWASIEYYVYKATYGNRPHVILTAHSDQRWFAVYRDQIEQLWNESEEWSQNSFTHPK